MEIGRVEGFGVAMLHADTLEAHVDGVACREEARG